MDQIAYFLRLHGLTQISAETIAEAVRHAETCPEFLGRSAIHSMAIYNAVREMETQHPLPRPETQSS